MQIERKDAKNLLINGLPDGSRVIVDSPNERVYALNSTAGAAWDACASQTTLSQVAESMRESCGSTISDEVAEQAIAQLAEKNLVKTSGPFAHTSRRSVIAGIGAVALPLVVSMTLGDQRAMAQSARSNPVGSDPVNLNPPPEDPGQNGGHNADRPLAHISFSTKDR